MLRSSPRPQACPRSGSAVTAFLATVGANTAKAYAIALRALVAELGEQGPLTDLEGQSGADCLATSFTARRGGAAAATFNARLDALGSACTWWGDQDWLTPGDSDYDAHVATAIALSELVGDPQEDAALFVRWEAFHPDRTPQRVILNV